MSRHSRRGDEPVITQQMIGLFVVAGADIILLVVLLAAVGVTSWSAALGISGFILAVFGGWVLLRWRRLRAEEATSDSQSAAPAERSPIETLKDRYAAGELSDDAFERKVDQLLESDQQRPHTSEMTDAVGRPGADATDRTGTDTTGNRETDVRDRDDVLEERL